MPTQVLKKNLKYYREEVEVENCIPAQWGVKVNVGDKVRFVMPPFCSGNYTFDVIEKYGIPVLADDAPSKIFDGCRDYKIIRKSA